MFRQIARSVFILIMALPAARAQSPGRSDAPAIPVAEIIQKMAAKETEFRAARENYTYHQAVHVQEFTASGRPGGEYRRVSDIVFTPEGRRFEHVSYEPPATLELVSMSPEDTRDLISIQPFVLTSDDLPLYDLQYEGRTKIDEIGTYVFRASPKRVEKGHRYFEGTIWVDDQDLQIVKTDGKAVPDLRRKDGENLFPRFETYRENIEGKYWFPTYTRADDVLHFKSGDVRIRMMVRYTDYKRFTVTARILTPGSEETKPPEN